MALRQKASRYQPSGERKRRYGSTSRSLSSCREEVKYSRATTDAVADGAIEHLDDLGGRG